LKKIIPFKIIIRIYTDQQNDFSELKLAQQLD